MAEFLRIMILLEAVMLSPIWVPLLGAAAGNMMDRIRGEQITPAQEAVRAAKARSELLHREIADQLACRRTQPVAVTDERADASVAA